MSTDIYSKLSQTTWDEVHSVSKSDRAAYYWYAVDCLSRPIFYGRRDQIVTDALKVANSLGIETTADQLRERVSALISGNRTPVSKPDAPVYTAEVVSLEAARKRPPPDPKAPWFDDALLFNKEGKLRKNHANAIHIFVEHPSWKGCLAHDEFRHEVTLLKCPPTDDAKTFKSGAEWTETMTTRAAAWLQKEYGVEFATSMVLEAALAAAEQNKFHPVRDWLSSRQWDGVARLDAFLPRYLGVRDSEYARAVGSKWMISAVARVYEPGCQADHMLVIEGPQGAGKSSAARELVPIKSLYADTGIDVGDKDSFQNLRGKWIYELAEMASIKGREVEKTKQFISSPKDTYRASYGRKSRDWPRQCVFIGTTNEMASYLADSTGNRRFWPVTAGTIDVKAIARDRDQLWAEAVQRYHAGEVWYLNTSRLVQLASEEQERREQVDPWQEYISEWLRHPWIPGIGSDGKPDRDPIDPDEGISVGQIAMGALSLRKQDATPAVEAKIGRIMAKLDWDRRQRRRGGDRVWLYFDPSPTSPAVTTEERPSPVTH